MVQINNDFLVSHSVVKPGEGTFESSTQNSLDLRLCRDYSALSISLTSEASSKSLFSIGLKDVRSIFMTVL